LVCEADFTLQCGDSQWHKYLPLAVAAVLVYPIGTRLPDFTRASCAAVAHAYGLLFFDASGIPLFLFLSLRNVRRRLNQPKVIASWGLCYDG
jgi:hypothetical protein